MILVTGTTGYVGGAAARRLLAGGHPVAVLARDARRLTLDPTRVSVRLADYDDRAGLAHAFVGIEALLFVASDGDRRDVMRHHVNVIDAAVASRIQRIVFTSIMDLDADSPFYFSPVYRDAESRLQATGIACVFLRCGLYADLVLEHWLRPALPSGVLSLPVGQGRVALVTRDDVAEAAAAAVTTHFRAGDVHELTGPRALSFNEIAAIASQAGKTFLRFETCTPDDYGRRARAELADPWPEAFSSLCGSIGEGRYERVGEGIERLLGRQPTNLQEFLRSSRAPVESRVLPTTRTE